MDDLYPILSFCPRLDNISIYEYDAALKKVKIFWRMFCGSAKSLFFKKYNIERTLKWLLSKSKKKREGKKKFYNKWSLIEITFPFVGSAPS